jgi:type VI secretion system secreted protein Hcp
MDNFYHLKLEGITGESSIEGHLGEIQLTEWNFSAAYPPKTGSSIGVSGKGRPAVSDLSCTARISRATPSLFEYSVSGRAIKSAKLTASKRGTSRGDFLVIDLEDVVITSYQARGSSDGEAPWETFTLAFVRITIHHHRRRRGEATSSVRKSWERGTKV